jgi:hypothetical protein
MINAAYQTGRSPGVHGVHGLNGAPKQHLFYASSGWEGKYITELRPVHNRVKDSPCAILQEAN